MKLSKKFSLVIIMLCSLVPSLAYAEKLLDKVDVIQTQTESEIHIEFLTQVRYIRHFPNNKETSRVQIFLEFPQLSSRSTQREFLNSPSTDTVPSFTVNYPDQKTNSIGVRFKKPIKFTITPDSSGRGIVIHVPSGKATASVTPIAVEPLPKGAVGEVPAKPASMTDNDYAAKLVAQGRLAKAAEAVELFNTVLGLPANTSSQEAQELIGNARENLGESAKAKAEYETYLKLYPQGDGAARVRGRIAAIDRTAKAGVVGAVKVKKPTREIHENTVYGSWDQYYYDAHSHNYDPIPANNSHTHDQSQLVSAINLTARFRQNEWDNKIVLNDVQTMDFLPGTTHQNRNRLKAAYVEINNKEVDYMARLGRQNGNSGGVLGRFDGALFRYGFTPKYKLNFVLGALDEYRVDYRRHFYGINLDATLNDQWSTNVYYINQSVGEVKDREAVGTELRYFKDGKSVYSLLDYDTMFNKVNIAMVQGNWLTEGGTNYNMLIDHRKSPILSMINSLQVFGGGTIHQALMAGATVPELRNDALALTSDSDLILLGATRQVTPRWQLGGDVQVSRTSGTAAAGVAAFNRAKKAVEDAGGIFDPNSVTILNASLASGNSWTYHAQAVGSDTIFKGDTSVISFSYTDAPTSKFQSLILSNVMVPRDKWRLDSSIKLLRVDIDPSTLQYIVAPTMRASYRLRDKATIEAEIGVEVTNINDQINGHSRTFRDFSFVGYRLDI